LFGRDKITGDGMSKINGVTGAVECRRAESWRTIVHGPRSVNHRTEITTGPTTAKDFRVTGTSW